MMLIFASFSCQRGNATFKNGPGLEHLPGLESMQGAHHTQTCFAEFRGPVGDKCANAMANLHHAHGREISYSGAQTGATDFKLPCEFALGRNFVSGLQSSVFNERADVVNHLHRSVGRRFVVLYPRHKKWSTFLKIKKNRTRRD